MESNQNLKNKQGPTEKEFLAKYDPNEFQRPSATVDLLIFTVVNEEKENYRKLPEKTLQILLVKRGDHPYMGKWALPGGFVSMEESLEEGALRKLKGETNIGPIYLEQLYTWGDPDRDPRTRVISVSYMALVDKSSLHIKGGEDATDVRWFNLKYDLFQEKKTTKDKGYEYEKQVRLSLNDEETSLSAIVKITEVVEGRVVKVKRELVESDGLAFDHGKIIEYAMERLRNKITYTEIAFNLMPERFTLTELQKVYEVIQGKELLAAAFRRKVVDMVKETNEYTKDAGHRPSKLYEYNSGWRNNLP